MFISMRLRKRGIAVAAAALVLAVLSGTLFLTRREQPDHSAEAHPVSAAAVVPAMQGRTVYLTFDDGPSRNTDDLLDVLAESGIHATFFVTGQNPDYFDRIARANEEGHLIALHTYSHRFAEIYAGSSAFWNDIEKLDELVYEQTGKHGSLLRFPGGSSNTVSRQHGGAQIMRTLIADCAARGITYVDWNVDTKDAENGTCDADTIVQRAIRGAEKVDGDLVILMHDGTANSTAAEATRELIQYFQQQGCVFDTLDHLDGEVHHNLP